MNESIKVKQVINVMSAGDFSFPEVYAFVNAQDDFREANNFYDIHCEVDEEDYCEEEITYITEHTALSLERVREIHEAFPDYPGSDLELYIRLYELLVAIMENRMVKECAGFYEAAQGLFFLYFKVCSDHCLDTQDHEGFEKVARYYTALTCRLI